MAHKKGASSTRNGRDSNPSTSVLSASAVRPSTQARSLSSARHPLHPGLNVGRGGDDTLFALAAGTVEFGTRKGRKVVNILAAAE